MIEIYFNKKEKFIEIEVDGVEVGCYPLSKGFFTALQNALHNASIEMSDFWHANEHNEDVWVKRSDK